MIFDRPHLLQVSTGHNPGDLIRNLKMAALESCFLDEEGFWAMLQEAVWLDCPKEYLFEKTAEEETPHVALQRISTALEEMEKLQSCLGKHLEDTVQRVQLLRRASGHG